MTGVERSIQTIPDAARFIAPSRAALSRASIDLTTVLLNNATLQISL